MFFMQVVAAFCELAIPHFATKSIFAASAAGATAKSYMVHLNWLAVRCTSCNAGRHPMYHHTEPYSMLTCRQAGTLKAPLLLLLLLQALVVFYGVFAALRGYCFSILNNRLTMRLRCGARRGGLGLTMRLRCGARGGV